MRRAIHTVIVTACGLLAACSHVPGGELSRGPSFPPPPATPRIRFLTSFSSSRDVTGQRRGFARLVFGESKETAGLDKPYGVAMYEGVVYACDTRRNVVAVFDARRRRFGLLGVGGPGKLRKPINITIDGAGRKYVADAQRGDVVVFDPTDTYERSFGAKELRRPVDVAVGPREIYVVDAATSEVVVFDRNTHRELRRFGGPGADPGRFATPTNVALAPDGNLYVTDTLNGRIQKVSPRGRPLATVGRLGDRPGEFARPKGIAVDVDGRLYAVDAAFENVQLFDDAGRLLMFFGGPGNDPGRLVLPADVSLDRTSVKYFRKMAPDFDIEYLVVVSSQYGPHRVSLYAFGRPKGAGKAEVRP